MAKQHWLVPSPSELPHLHTRRLCPCQHWGHVLDQSLLFISLLNYLGVEKQYLPPKQDVTFAPVPFINFLIPFTSFLACDIFYFSRPTLNPGSSSLLVDQPAGYLWKRESTVVGLGWGPITCISFFFFFGVWLIYNAVFLSGVQQNDSGIHIFSSVQSLGSVRFFVTPWIAASQASLSVTNSWSLLKLMSIESVMPSSHLILCRPLLLLPPIPPSIRVFSSEAALRIRWPKD